MTLRIPDSHLDLLTEPVHGILTTMMPDGQPQSSIVWCDYDGEHVRINTTAERQKSRNVQRNPKATLLVIDRRDAGRWIEVRGEAELTQEGALQHLDEITVQYSQIPYYGGIFPAERQYQETRTIIKLRPNRINIDAIHA